MVFIPHFGEIAGTKTDIRVTHTHTHTHTHTSTQYGDLGYLRVHPYILKGQEVAF